MKPFFPSVLHSPFPCNYKSRPTKRLPY